MDKLEEAVNLMTSRLLPAMQGKLKALDVTVQQHQSTMDALHVFLTQVGPKLIERIKALEAAKPVTEPPETKRRRGRPSTKRNHGAEVAQELKPEVMPEPPVGQSLDDISELIRQGESVVAKDLWEFNGQIKTAAEWGFADLLDLPLPKRAAAFRERGFVDDRGEWPRHVGREEVY